MNPFDNYDAQSLTARCDHIGTIVAPRKEELRAILEMSYNIVCNIPPFPDEEISRDAMDDPQTFMEGILLAKYFEIAMAEQQTKTTYSDEQLFDKVRGDLEADIAEIAQLERSAGSGMTH